MSGTDPIDQIDSLLGDVLSAGWGDEPAPPAPVHIGMDFGATPVEAHVYPPLPVKNAVAPRRARVDKAQALALAKAAMDEAGIEYTDSADEPPADDEAAPSGLLDIGLLADLATGRKSAVEAAEAAGITPAQVQSQLATALRDIDPKELAKALSMQAGEQRLKSGAIYGVVLQELVQDMMQARLSPAAKLEFAKLLANVGGITPKEDKTVAQGSGFVLNISMGSAAPQPITIEAQ